MVDYAHVLHSYHFASTYGEGSFNSSTYNGDTNTNTNTAPGTPGTTVPGTPNTGFFNGVFSGANEASLIPLLLVVAVAVGAITVGITKFVRRRREHATK